MIFISFSFLLNSCRLSLISYLHNSIPFIIQQSRQPCVFAYNCWYGWCRIPGTTREGGMLSGYADNLGAPRPPRRVCRTSPIQ